MTKDIKTYKGFVYEMPVRIDDINYGNHLAHDKIVTMMHEARIQYFKSIGQSELDFFGASLILTKMNFHLKAQAYHMDTLKFFIDTTIESALKMRVCYMVYNKEKDTLVADAEVSLCFFDYERGRLKKIDLNKVNLSPLTKPNNK